MKNFNIKQILQTLSGVSLFALATFFIFSSAKSDTIRRCEGIKINIKDNANELLVNNKDIENWVTNNGQELLLGKTINSIDLEGLERKITNSGIIKNCEAYIDLKGNLILDVEVYNPIARILGNGSFADRYMDEEGHFFPTSKNFTPTVMLVSGSYFNNRKGLESMKNYDLLSFIKQINKDEFWNAQITRIDVNINKEIQFVPLLGENIVEFGKPEKIDTKLRKLMVFYKKIMPLDQWSGFKHVSVKYDGQIVCN